MNIISKFGSDEKARKKRKELLDDLKESRRRGN
jgi:hypothetical protein